ncbi:MAG: LacI family DNA-binding transcriptional regulator, partial [Oscillospiraceae bacterium]|nr:LacI family DNA-binding transcriptional regulator [Oscillospiraceae bacterium]
MPSVTLKDVAKVAGVSYATVSRAISGSTEIGEETRKRIVAICKEMGYTPNSVARSMVKRRTEILGLIVPSLNNPFMSELTSNLEIYARNRGYNLMVCNSSYDHDLEKDVFSLLAGRQVDGVIMIPIGPESFAPLQPLASNIPTVFIGENLKKYSGNYVSVDNTLGMQLATEYLYSLGHRRILYFGARSDSRTHQSRLRGYTSTCEKLGIEPRVLRSSYSRSSREVGYILGGQYFFGEREETAILCAADMLAIGVMQAAYEAGVRVPDDISVMGFD